MGSCHPKAHHTPECFMAVLEVASENEDAVVVQAWLHNQNRWILHTWCEIDDRVIDLTEGRSPIPKTEYYAVMGVTETRARRYSRQAYFAMAAKAGHFGPFDSELFFAEAASTDPLTHIPKERTEVVDEPQK